MKYLLLASAAALIACGKDATGPGEAIQCETQKRSEIATAFGASYTPTDELLRQNFWTAGTRSWTWNTANCTVTRSP